jgi:hypothetical protein
MRRRPEFLLCIVSISYWSSTERVGALNNPGTFTFSYSRSSKLEFNRVGYGIQRRYHDGYLALSRLKIQQLE